MSSRCARRGPAGTTAVAGAIWLIVALLGLLGVATGLSVYSGEDMRIHGGPATGAVSNGSGGGDPASSASASLCPSTGPVILGVQWNCVAILNLTEIALIFAAIGLVAYVFKGADKAELPGDAAEVPVTAEELEDYRRDRALGVRFQPPEPPPEGNE